MFSFPYRVKAAQTELGQQILADFEEAFPSQGTKVLFCIFPSVFGPYHHVCLAYTHCSYCSFAAPEAFASSQNVCWLEVQGNETILDFKYPKATIDSPSVSSQHPKVRICFSLI